jgi:hypothetical protein
VSPGIPKSARRVVQKSGKWIATVKFSGFTISSVSVSRGDKFIPKF